MTDAWENEVIETPSGNGSRVSYSTKEIVARIDTKIDKLFEELRNKAEKLEVTKLEARLEKTETRILAIENRTNQLNGVWHWVITIGVPSAITVALYVWLRTN